MENKLLAIHPLQNDCQSKFAYTGSGEIIGVDSDAIDTIKILALNIENLVRMRNAALSPFPSVGLSAEELKKIYHWICDSKFRWKKKCI